MKTLEELRIRKREIEEKIYPLLIEFESEFGCTVPTIEMVHQEFSDSTKIIVGIKMQVALNEPMTN